MNGVGVPTFMLRTVGNSDGQPIALTLTSGRAPGSRNEAAIGPATARELHAHVGDTIRVGAVRNPTKIVGEALFPSDVHTGFDQGMWLTPAGFVATAPPVDIKKQVGPERLVAVRFAPGAMRVAATQKLRSALGDSVGDVGSADVPVELTNLRNVQTLPVVLAVFLALLAVAAATHGLMTSARVRGREFAILRSLGLTPRGMRAVLNSQGTTIAAAGLVVGVPIGIIVGRAAWATLTGAVPLENVPPLPAIGVAILLPGVVLLAVAIALLSSHRVVRLQPGKVLRTE